MKRWLLIALSLAILGPACGTRQSHEAILAAAGSREGNRADATADTTGAVDGELGDTGTSDVATATGTATGGTGATTARAGSASTAGRASTGRSTGSPGAAGAVVGPGQKSPVKIANVGTISGVVGSVLYPTVQGLQAWIRHINDKGGVNGHPVRMNVVDDGGDPARHRAQVQEQIEKEKVLALVGNNEPLTGKQSVSYITSKRVPVVGSETGGQWFYDSPMYFPQASSGDNLVYLALASAAPRALARGKRKLGTTTCTEAQICTDADRLWSQYGAQFGMTPVYRSRASLAQPDFTAECISARNAGVEMWQFSMDTNSVSRIAGACARQGYHPIFSYGASIVADRQKSDKNLEGSLGNLNVFPWFQSNTPATQEFQEAIRRYAPNATAGVGIATGWTTGKLFEKATLNLPEPPTSQAILRGLWAIKNDTLGGITQPLTFIENKNTPQGACWFDIELRGGKWTSSDSYKIHCRNRPGT